MDERKPAALEYNSEEDDQGIAPMQLKNHAELMSLQQCLVPTGIPRKNCIPLLKQSLVEKGNCVQFDDSIVPKRSDDLHRSQLHPDLIRQKPIVDRGANNTINGPPILQPTKRTSYIFQHQPSELHIEELLDGYEEPTGDSVEIQEPKHTAAEQPEEQVDTGTSMNELPELKDVTDPLLGVTPPSSPKDILNTSSGNGSEQKIPGSFLEALTGRSNDHSTNENEWTTVQNKKHSNPKHVQSPQSAQ